MFTLLHIEPKPGIWNIPRDSQNEGANTEIIQLEDGEKTHICFSPKSFTWRLGLLRRRMQVEFSVPTQQLLALWNF